MNEMMKSEKDPAWVECKKRVVESFDLDDVGTNYGVSRWLEHVEKERGVEEAGEMAYRFTSPQVLDAAVDFFKTDIAENIAIFQARIARNDRQRKLMELRLKLGEVQGVFVDEEKGERIVPELLGVMRITKSSKTKMLHQLVTASMTMAGDNGDEEIAPPIWPTGLGDGIQDFANDLNDFVSTNGDKGREMVMRVCQDTAFAKKVRNDEELPKAIRFLASIVTEVNTDSHLPERERPIGFGFAGQ